MTSKEIDQLNRIMLRADFKCEVCGEPIGMTGCRSHRIACTKANYKIYGKEIINHDYNVLYTHQKCNDSVNIGNNKGKCERLVAIINSDMPDIILDNSGKDITDYLEE